MSAEFEIEDHTDRVKAAVRAAALRAMEVIGGKVETYAKGLAPVDTSALRNSITHTTKQDGAETTTTAGSNVEYAAYVELGTGKLYSPPPAWEEGHGKRGRGLDKWVYQDKDGFWHTGYPRAGVKFLQRAVMDHLEEYGNVIKTELSEIK